MSSGAHFFAVSIIVDMPSSVMTCAGRASSGRLPRQSFFRDENPFS
jgi:hypothetical protein